MWLLHSPLHDLFELEALVYWRSIHSGQRRVVIVAIEELDDFTRNC